MLIVGKGSPIKEFDVQRTGNPGVYLQLNVSGTGEDQTDYILRVNVHCGSGSGDATGQDIYLNKYCKTDFSDVYFTDEDGNRLAQYIANKGNYEFVQTSTRAGYYNLILSDGSILSADLIGHSGSHVLRSTNNGNSWTLVYDGDNDTIPLIQDSRGYIFIIDGSILKRSIDNCQSWSTVCDISDVNGTIRPFGIDEAPNGYLYFGRYQEALNSARIYRSIDGGETWNVVWSDNTRQHVHGLKADPYTGYIYAGIDDNETNGISIIRSVDNGVNWTVIYTGLSGNATGIVCGNGYRLFAAESVDEKSIKRTTNDTDFTTVLASDYTIKSMQAVGDTIYAFGVSFYRNNYPAIFRSTDAGLTWETIWTNDFDGGLSAGYANNFRSFGIPTGEDALCTIAGGISGDRTYPASRLYHGGNHYQSTFYIKIPLLPASGTKIYIKSSGEGISSKSIFGQIHQYGVLARYKFDEGTGLSVADSSGNNFNAVLRSAGIGSWNAFNGRRIGSRYPELTRPGSSYHFNGTGWQTSSYATITGSDTNPSFQFVKNFTVLAWIRTTRINAEQTIIGKGRDNSRWGLLLYGSLGTLTFLVSNGSSSSMIYATNAPNNGFNAYMAFGLWSMVGVVVDDATPANIKFFVNGRLFSAQALPYDIQTNAYTIRIGCDSSDTKYFVGDIDDVQIYNTALTELQLRSIYEDRPVSETRALISQ